MIGILDYGMGNLYSVSQALERLGESWIISADHEELDQTDGLILPGVGAFSDAMRRLKASGDDVFLKQYTKKRPLLGICLGMQLLFDESTEHGECAGLGLLKGRAVLLSGIDRTTGLSYKVPHIGWNRLKFHQLSHRFLENLEEDYVYFVHSYYMEGMDDEVTIATADYHEAVPAIVGKENLYGMQFHPEKSAELGMALLKQFCLITAQERRR